MNEHDNTLLNNYFNGLLGPEDARAVEARVLAESEFGAEFSLRKEMEAFPRKEARGDAFLATLKHMEGEYFQEKGRQSPPLTVVRNNMRRWIALAASVTLIAAAVWLFNQNTTPVYEKYAQHTPLSLTVMGNTAQAKSDAETAFGQKDFARALTALDQVLVSEPDHIKATFYRGICLLELGRGPEARAVFEPLAAGRSALREDAVWYLGLSYLKEKDLEGCKLVLIKIDTVSVHYKAAQEILKGF